MMTVVYCSCGENLCNRDGECIKCGKRRMLPHDLNARLDAITTAVEDFKTAVVEWMNKNANMKAEAEK